MRVLLLSSFYVLGGSSIVIENLADQLSKSGVDVTIGALAFKRVPSNGDYDVKSLPVYNPLKLKRFLDTFDIVHSHHPLTNYLALINRKPFVYHYHGAPNFGKGCVFRLSMISSIKITNHRFDAVIAVSEAGRDEFEQYFSLNKVYVIYNGVDTNLFKLGLEERFRKGTPQFLFVGNLYAHKNVNEILFALKKLIKLYPMAYLMIVGEGNRSDNLRNLIAELNLQKHVSLVGYVSHHELPYYYSSSDVYITASRCEHFSLPLIEAWACGKPVIASNIPAHLALLKKSEAGLAYKVGNIPDLVSCMAYIYEHKDEFSEKGLSFAENNDWSLVAGRVKKIYKTVCKRELHNRKRY